MTDAERSILAGRLYDWQCLLADRSHCMYCAIRSFIDGNEAAMWVSLFDWAEADYQMTKWWAAYRLDFVDMTEIVGAYR